MTPSPHPESVAVIIPTRNRWPWVGEAIDSALAQRHPHTHVIVVDDASTDDTVDRIHSIYADRVQLLQNSSRQQKSFSRNHGIRTAQTEFVCMLDSDDLLMPDSLENRLRPFREEPSWQGVVYGSRISEHRTNSAPATTYPSGYILKPYFQDFGLLDNNAFLLRRQVMLDVGMYREDLTNMEDREMLLRLVAHLPFHYYGQATHRVRRVDPNSARTQYGDIVKQGTAFSDALRQDPVLMEKMGSDFRLLEYAEAHEQIRALYKLKRYRDYLIASASLQSRFPELAGNSFKQRRRRGIARVLQIFSDSAKEPG